MTFTTACVQFTRLLAGTDELVVVTIRFTPNDPASLRYTKGAIVRAPKIKLIFCKMWGGFPVSSSTAFYDGRKGNRTRYDPIIKERMVRPMKGHAPEFHTIGTIKAEGEAVATSLTNDTTNPTWSESQLRGEAFLKRLRRPIPTDVIEIRDEIAQIQRMRALFPAQDSDDRRLRKRLIILEGALAKIVK